jgi:ADP-ribose pyrophosphatase YjhB (NUDIX family)
VGILAVTWSLSCNLHTLVADVALLAEGRGLLVRYKDTNKYDHQSGWFLPDDALNHFEHPEMGAKRILKEQLGVSAPKLTLGLLESFKGDAGTWHLAFHYKAEFNKAPQIEPSEDLDKSEWFPMNQLPDRSQVAHHGWAISVLNAMNRN